MSANEHQDQVISKIRQQLEKCISYLGDCAQELNALSSPPKHHQMTQSLKSQHTFPDDTPENRFFSIWTEKGHSNGTQSEYEKAYKKAPPSWGPCVWIDLISGTHSIRRGRKRYRINLASQQLELLCIFLRNFDRLVSKVELEDKIINHPQVLYELHRATFEVLRPFMDIVRGEARKLMTRTKDNRRVKLTFCLIEQYKVSDENNKSPHNQRP
jgi:hypothetical protein